MKNFNLFLKFLQEKYVWGCINKYSNQKFQIEIAGLEIMNDDPGEVDVLYGKVKDPEGNLQEVAERIVDR